ncbi:MAG: glycosyltransferase [Candidatus Hodarchaeota archaeon]
MRRILHVTYHGGAGGVSVLILNLVKIFSTKEDISIDVCYASQEGAVAEELKGTGVSTYCLYMQSGFDLLRAFRLVSLIRRGGYDVVHLHYFTPALRLMALLARPPLVVQTEHGGIKGEIGGKRWLAMRPIHRLLRSAADVYTAVSSDSKRDLVTYRFAPEERTEVIYNGIFPSEFAKDEQSRITVRSQLGIPPLQIVVGTVRSLTPKMGIDHLIRCIPKVRAKIPDVTFLIVGDGPLRHDLECLAKKISVDNSILFLGERRDVRTLLSAMDIFVMPSVWETFGIAALEAMAAELPVVAYAVGGLKEVVEHGVTGLLLPDRNYHDLAKAITVLAKDPDRRAEMGSLSKKRTEKLFDLKEIANSYMSLYERELKRKFGSERSRL